MHIKEFFEKHPNIALALSGGADSAYLLYAAKKYANRVKAYYVKSAFQPGFELEDAKRLAEELSTELRIIDVDILSNDKVTSNTTDRCYHCKKVIFEAIVSAASNDGLDTVIDGTNASDDLSDRPGIRAIRELGVLSPLRECGITKAELRRLSKEAGLFTHEKPAYACLATRIPTGTHISEDKLLCTENAEKHLFELGFKDFRVRYRDGAALIQLRKADFPLLIAHQDFVFEELKKYYKAVYLDLEVRNEN